jgi:hypothetical protein
MGEPAPGRKGTAGARAALGVRNEREELAMAEEKETIVHTDGGGGGGGVIVAVVLLIAVVVVLFLVFGRGLLGGQTDKIDADVKIDTPAPGGGG